jgi:hypothetical protein
LFGYQKKALLISTLRTELVTRELGCRIISKMCLRAMASNALMLLKVLNSIRRKGQKMSSGPVPLEDRFQKLIHDLKDLVREHNALPAAEGKRVRHALYQREGGFGRMITSLFPEIEKLEQKLVNTNKA